MTTYVKKTWTTNEVIETAEMNNIETGVYDSFKSSEQIIDSNKDMNGKTITNVGAIDVVGNATVAGGLWAQYGQLLAPPSQDAIFRVYQDNTTKCVSQASGYIVKSVTVPSKYIVPGSIYVKFNHTGVGGSRIYVNGIASITSSGVLNDIKAGDVIGVNTGGNNENQGCNSLFEIYALDVPISNCKAW